MLIYTNFSDRTSSRLYKLPTTSAEHSRKQR